MLSLPVLDEIDVHFRLVFNAVFLAEDTSLGGLEITLFLSKTQQIMPEFVFLVFSTLRSTPFDIL